MQIARGKTFIGIGGAILAVELMGVPSWLAFILLFVSLIFFAWGVAPVETRRVLDRVPIPNFPDVLDKLDRIIESPHKTDDRLHRVKHELGDLWAEAQKMRENAEAKQIETQVLQEPEKTERLAEWDVPDCKDWHKRTYEYLENEIGTHKAMEFCRRYNVSEAYDFKNPGFIAKFLRTRQEDFSKIIDNLKEEDLS